MFCLCLDPKIGSLSTFACQPHRHPSLQGYLMNHLSPHTHARTHTHAHRQPHVIYAYKSVYVRVKPAQMHKRHVLHESVHNNWNNSVDLLWFLLYCRYLDGNRNADRLHTQLPTDVMCPVWHTCKKTPAKTLLVNVKCIHIYTISSIIKPISDWPLTRRVVAFFLPYFKMVTCSKSRP